MSQHKIESVLSVALKHLENCLDMFTRISDEMPVYDSLWSASAETEYAIFLLSLSLGDEVRSRFPSNGSKSRQSIEFRPSMVLAHEHLKSATRNLELGNWEKSCGEAWVARSLLLKAQELLEKRRRKEAEK